MEQKSDGKGISPKTMELLVKYQRDEITGAVMYKKMAWREKDHRNREILSRMAMDEEDHARIWERYTGRDIQPNRLKILWLTFLNFLLGYTFVIRRMEMDETATVAAYRALLDEVPEVRAMMEQEEQHEQKLLTMLDEERLHYVGAMVLGLNDALVELTGTIAGLTLALANTRLVAMAGIITGVSATLSMAASNYLAERAEGSATALKSSLYTGTAYLITVVCLVLPYLLFPDNMYMAALAVMLAVVILIIFCFNYYISVAKSLPFGQRFVEMACISLGVAVVSFGIGLAAKAVLGVDI